MKKCFLALLTVCFLLISIAGFAEINLASFEDAEGFTYEYDDMTDTYNIGSTSDLSTLMTEDKTASVSFSLVPIEGEYILRMEFYSFNLQESSGRGVDGLIIKVGDTRYTADLSVAFEDNYATAYVEYAVLPLGTIGLDMTNDIIMATDEVKIRITGSNADVDFVLNATQLAEIEKWYTQYIDAGGADQTMIPLLDTIYPITISQ